MNKLNLMKGDWVKVKNSDHLTNVQVDGFIGDSIFTKEAEYESEEINIEDVEPIAITHELHMNYLNKLVLQFVGMRTIGRIRNGIHISLYLVTALQFGLHMNG